MLSTAHVISGVGQLWDFATSSLPVLRHRTTSGQNTEILQKENTFYYPAEGNIIASISSEAYNDGETNSVENSDPDNAATPDNDMTAKNNACYNGLSENQESSSNENMINRNTEIFSSPLYKSQYGLAKQEHAFAGAFAGTFVSLCLHPIDTVKTVVQSCHTDQRSIPHISKSIISERGLLGLYRGIASNIASSAPISAIYTFSYESVKAALLPLFAKEHHSLAHCVAGGCASVATSFVFTPSERIKQQMQVSSRYHSCWNALLGIVGKGGFLSLYNGWGAVLCRNVPHSIIKLLCGGLAGSTAALFTTPFDVVKTRLQTQFFGTDESLPRRLGASPSQRLCTCPHPTLPMAS
ncbi:hypothetical protein E3N88_46241 [Mikania micrantha]|uniref:Uncharacterized protein n=1 Tax=Mikania micrantha TaxID=192012 RepID=A0A5N6L747_9ASTR|nr:hypothetical protein E3N88_46241 [Mikania micrantha]